MTRLLQWASCGSLVGLVALCLAWELWLAPLRPGGSSLAFKCLPLLLPLPGLLRGKRYTYQWAWILALVYFTEGVVRSWSEADMSRVLALGEVALSLALFVSVVLYARHTGRAS